MRPTSWKKPSRSLWAIVLVVLAMILGSCAPSTAVPPQPISTPPPSSSPLPQATLAPSPTIPVPIATQVKRGGTLRLVTPQEAAHWDPHRTPTTVEMWEYLGNYIVNFDPTDGHPVPEVAERWEFKGPLTLVLHIRRGVRFHNLPPGNGHELKAEDVVWNLNRIRRPGAEYIWKSNFEPVESITAVDDYTVELKMSAPFAPLLSYLKGVNLPSQPMLDPAVESKLGQDAYKDLLNARGTGPFMIKSYTPKVGAVAVRNPDYWQQGRPYLDAVEMIVVPDAATMLAAYRTGRVDTGASTLALIGVDAKRDLERSQAKLRFAAVSDFFTVNVVPNLTKPPFNDIRLRKAIFLAIDRQEMLTVNLSDSGHISGPLSWKLFPGWTWSEQDLMKREGYRPKASPEGQQDITQAQDLVRQLGYGPNNPLQIKAEASSFAPFVNLTPMEVAKSELKKVWIDLSIQMVDPAQWFEQDAKGDFLMRSRGYIAPPEPDAQLFTRHHTKGGRNFQKLSDPELDRLIEAQRRELDLVKRKEMVLAAQEKLWSLYPMVWLQTRESFIVLQPWLEMQPTTWRMWGDPASTWISR